MADTVTAYLFNFTFVLSWVIIFFVPFAGYFYYRHRKQIRDKKPHFNQFMELFFESKSANWLVFFWALGEAIIWFMIPEFLLFLIIFMRVKKKRELLLYDISGTAAGTIVGLLVHMKSDALLNVPYIYPGMISQVREWYETMGIWALLNQPLSGVPYKVFISEFHNYAIPVVLFVLLAILIRLLRYAGVYYFLLATYPVLNKIVRRHYSVLFVLGIVVFTFMLMKVSGIYG